MIYIRLAGGLGNQLFQLAAGLEMQYRTNQAIGIYAGDLKRYAVKREAAALNLIQLSEIINICNKNSLPVLALRGRLGRFGLPFCVNDRTIANPSATQKHYLLDGYFQNVEFIKQGINALVSMIGNSVIHENLKAFFYKVIAGVNMNEICALHVRRGDYLSKAGKSLFPLFDRDYYKKGIELIGNQIKKIVIFSDDPSIEFDFFREYDTVRVSDHQLADYQELILMSMFNNLIIANSTFSFWSALLNSNDNKRIIAPLPWSYISNVNNIWKNNLEKTGIEIVDL
jgi:hypothetical protein